MSQQGRSGPSRPSPSGGTYPPGTEPHAEFIHASRVDDDQPLSTQDVLRLIAGVSAQIGNVNHNLNVLGAQFHAFGTELRQTVGGSIDAANRTRAAVDQQGQNLAAANP